MSDALLMLCTVVGLVATVLVAVSGHGDIAGILGAVTAVIAIHVRIDR